MTGFGGHIGTTIADSQPHWPTTVEPVPGRRPNVLVVVFDDVGFSDFGCYGSEIATPTIDRLAAGGLRYSGFHTTAMCSTTRAALLTGRNHHNAGVGCLANFDSGYPGYRGKITREAGTLAELLTPYGYRCYATGKWHVTPLTETGPTGPYDGWPLQRGFHRYYGFLDAETDQYAPELVHDNHHVDPPGTFEDGYHLSADIADRTIGFLKDHLAGVPDEPWLSWVAFGACHAPHQAPVDIIDRYEAVFAKGWDATRDERLARQIELGIVPPGTVLPERNPHVRVALGQDGARGHDAELDLAGQALVAGGVPALGEHGLVAVDDVDRGLVGRMAGAEGDPRQPRLVGHAGQVVLQEPDRAVGDVGAEVVAVLERARGVDVVVVVHQLGRVLVGLGVEEAVVAVEAPLQGPAVVGPGRAGLGQRRHVPLAGGVAAVAVGGEQLGERARLAGDLAPVAGVPGVEVRQAADPGVVVVATGEQRRPGGRAHRGGVEARVAQAAGGQAVDGGRGDLGAVAAEVAEPDVVEDHDEDVGTASGHGLDRGRPVRLRVRDRRADVPPEPGHGHNLGAADSGGRRWGRLPWPP